MNWKKLATEIKQYAESRRHDKKDLITIRFIVGMLYMHSSNETISHLRDDIIKMVEEG